VTRDGAWAAHPFWRYALIASAAVHVGLFALFTQIRVPDAPRLPSLRAKPIPVELVTPPKPKPAPVVVPRVEPEPEPAKPKPAPVVRTTRPAPVKPAATAPRPTPTPRPAATAPAPPRTDPKPPASDGSPPSGGGAPVGLGTLAPGGDLTVEPGRGSGGTPVGTVPGSGTGTGSGTGPGSGEGPPGTADPKPNPTPAPPPPPPPPPPPEPKPKPPEPPKHTSTLADRAIPKLVKRVNPTYPLSAKEEGVQGTVQLRLRVEKNGSVSNVRVSKSSGDRRLNDAAVAAVKKWKYEPAVQNGVPRAVDTFASVSFRLQ